MTKFLTGCASSHEEVKNNFCLMSQIIPIEESEILSLDTTSSGKQLKRDLLAHNEKWCAKCGDLDPICEGDE